MNLKHTYDKDDCTYLRDVAVAVFSAEILPLLYYIALLKRLHCFFFQGVSKVIALQK